MEEEWRAVVYFLTFLLKYVRMSGKFCNFAYVFGFGAALTAPEGGQKGYILLWEWAPPYSCIKENQQ